MGTVNMNRSLFVTLLACLPFLTLCEEGVTEITTMFPEISSTALVSITNSSTAIISVSTTPTTAATTTTTTTTVAPPESSSTVASLPDLSIIEKELIPHILNVSENVSWAVYSAFIVDRIIGSNVGTTWWQVVDEKRDKEAELLAWEAPLDIRTNFPYYLSGFDAEDRPSNAKIKS